MNPLIGNYGEGPEEMMKIDIDKKVLVISMTGGNSALLFE